MYFFVSNLFLILELTNKISILIPVKMKFELLKGHSILS